MITGFYAGLLGILYFIISLETIRARGREKVSLGIGEHNQLLHIVSAHSNFASYTPIFLILHFFAGAWGPPLFLHALGTAFFIGRSLHFLTMRDKERTFRRRKLGMMLTLWPLIILSGANVVFYLLSVVRS
jgi:uncharacterized membrane protein YecN with MAPEG domain